MDGTVALEVEFVVEAGGREVASRDVASREVLWGSGRVGEGVKGVVGGEGAVWVSIGGLWGRFLEG